MKNKIRRRLLGEKSSYGKPFLQGCGVGKMLTKKYFHNRDGRGKVTYGEGFP